MTDLVIRRLRVVSAQRTEGFAPSPVMSAVHELPDALERAIGGSVPDDTDIHIDRLRVVLDLDGVDREAIAVLWADAIRVELTASLGRRADGMLSSAPPRAGSAQALTPELDTVSDVSRPQQQGDAADPFRVPPAPQEPQDQPTSMGEAVRSDVGAVPVQDAPPPWGSDRFSAPDSTPSRMADPAARSLTSPPLSDATPAPEHAGTSPLVAPPPLEDVPCLPSESPSPPEPGMPIADRLPARDRLVHTQVGGIVLLYPVLARVGERASAIATTLDPVDARRYVFAAICSDEDPDALSQDLLIRYLAGADEDRPDRAPLPPHQQAQVRGLADESMSWFATTLGAPDADRARLRAEAIRRPAQLTLLSGLLLVELEPRGFDEALRALPYPLGAFALPWTPVVTVRWNRGDAA